MSNATKTDLTVANTILAQMGGVLALRMIGGKAMGGDNFLQIRFAARAKNGANVVRVTLTELDTYTVEFFKVRGTTVKNVDDTLEAYAEDLVRIFEDLTGLYLHF